MLRSLVGSEMCIRDRQKGSAPAITRSGGISHRRGSVLCPSGTLENRTFDREPPGTGSRRSRKGITQTRAPSWREQTQKLCANPVDKIVNKHWMTPASAVLPGRPPECGEINQSQPTRNGHGERSFPQAGLSTNTVDKPVEKARTSRPSGSNPAPLAI